MERSLDRSPEDRDADQAIMDLGRDGHLAAAYEARRLLNRHGPARALSFIQHYRDSAGQPQ